MLDIKDIMKYLPHRYPFLMVDRVLTLEPNLRIVAIKNVSINEPYFMGHFPSTPIMPGVMIIEAIAQAAGILCLNSLETKTCSKIYLMALDKIKFRRPVVPGDQIRIEVEVLHIHRFGWKFKGKAFVEDHVAAEGEFLATIVKE
jgi:3-hydroxyacyl-[acyl-carrier-protein] dehydratase